MGKSFRDLEVWKRAIELTVVVYRLTATFPESERFGLVNQLRRAAVSIASNVAEGYGRNTKGEYLQFLGHSRGSNAEVETQLIISRELRFGELQLLDKAEALCSETGKMLNAMMKTLQTNP